MRCKLLQIHSRPHPPFSFHVKSSFISCISWARARSSDCVWCEQLSGVVNDSDPSLLGVEATQRHHSRCPIMEDIVYQFMLASSLWTIPVAIQAVSRTCIDPLSACIPDMDFATHQCCFSRTRPTDIYKTVSDINLV